MHVCDVTDQASPRARWNSPSKKSDNQFIVYGEELNYVSQKDVKLSYQLLPSYLVQFQTQNPGSMIHRDIKCNDLGRVKRALIIVGVFADARFARQSVFAIDCSHSKCAKYSGTQIHLMGRDGNMKI